ncbi:MAG: YbaY family lipoprotein [Acidimicrobiia bacterium]|nr:YbaY family lipoprotein [Acidimicrobiia bacterium]
MGDIDSRNTYSVSARIEESDGRLAFINDTAYDVITRGNPKKVDMVLVLVEAPPEMVDGSRIVVDVTAWVPAPTPWAIDCSARDLELDAYVYLGDVGEQFTTGDTYTVEVNGQESLTLAVP